MQDRPKGINSLMRYMRNEHGISISGSTHKRKLMHIGYFHGFKGYRFVKDPNNRIEFSHFDEVIKLYEFDLKLKTLLYPQIMLLETTIKNLVLQIILDRSSMSCFNTIFDSLLNGHQSYNTGTDKHKQAMISRLNLRKHVYEAIARDYGSKDVIRHYYNNDRVLPIWAIFEIISLGEFGNLVKCLNLDVKLEISKELNIPKKDDTNGSWTENTIFILKDLRNALAHNAPVFDTRFKTSNPSKSSIVVLSNEIGVTNIQFSTMSDYIILIAYLMKKIQVPKTEIKRFIGSFERLINELHEHISGDVYNQLLHTDVKNKLNLTRSFISK